MPVADPLVTRWFDTRIGTAIRWMLASTALIIIYLDPAQPDNAYWQLSYVLLTLYALYSTILYFLAFKRAGFMQLVESWVHWVDVAWFTVLVGLCSGTFRIFFFGYLFAILIASFRRGFATGFSVVIVSTLSYTVVGYTIETANANPDYGFEVYRFLLRPVYLVVLGYLIAYWGGQEIMLKRRLALLKDITLSNPRFGVDRTINSMLESLRNFYDTDVGLLVTKDLRAGGYLLYKAERKTAQPTTALPEAISAELASRLLTLPQRLAVCFNRSGRIRRPFFSPFYAYDVDQGERVSEGQHESEALSATLDDSSFITVPVLRHGEVTGRMYFSAQTVRSFNTSDIDFLLQVIEHVNPVVENIRLVDRLASDAAEQERHRIARDIHDSVIQPYIGFQIGLSGIRRKLVSGKADVHREVDRLLEMTSIGITDLRQYVGGLKNSNGHGASLISSVQRFTSKFSEATGIEVRIESPIELGVNDGLAAEAFQMIAEGLSNIRRHTEATRACIRIECDSKNLTLRIENNCPSGKIYAPFTPRSLTERAASLGGQARVERRADGGTVVLIEIPL